MKIRTYLLLGLALLVCLAAGMAYAAPDQSITRWWAGPGGGRATGGNVAISAVVGQAVAGPATGGQIAVCSGFWCGGPAASSLMYVFLPSIPKQVDPYAPACSPSNNYCEENDGPAAAYGPLAPSREYRAYPDDQNDYYYFEVGSAFSLNCQVTGYLPEGQLIVYDNNLVVKGSDFNNAGGDGVMSVVVSGLAPGKYYVRIYTASGFTNSNLYTLRVSW